MKTTITILTLVHAITLCYSQDIILKKSGEEISSKVLEIGSTEIAYKDFDNQDGATFILPTSEIFMIRFINGTKEVFTDEETDVQVFVSEEELILKGTQDAILNYTGKKSGAGWTAAATILLSPLIGVIPAAACASSGPDTQNLKYEDNQLMEYSSYHQAYRAQAHKIKKKKSGEALALAQVPGCF